MTTSDANTPDESVLFYPGPVRAACASTHQLAEGPLWDPARSELIWVDIVSQCALVGTFTSPTSIEVTERIGFDGPVSAVAVTPEGDWLVAVADSIRHRSRSGAELASFKVFESGTPGRRTNDGKLDPFGRLVVGTLGADSDPPDEVLVRLESDGSLSVLDRDLRLSNGLAWSSDGRVLYTVDSLQRRVYRRDYAVDRAGLREVHIEIDEGMPDGMCIDVEDHLWIAMWGLGEVRRYSPGGRLVGILRVPAPHTTSVAFAGPDLDTLVITTASIGLTPEELRRYPESGRLFACVPGVRGVPSC